MVTVCKKLPYAAISGIEFFTYCVGPFKEKSRDVE
jgi:hypothetical protein